MEVKEAAAKVGTTLVGTYGTLTLNADGSYTYAADQDAANSLKEEIVPLIISTIQ